MREWFDEWGIRDVNDLRLQTVRWGFLRDFDTVGDLVRFMLRNRDATILTSPNFGKKSLRELKTNLKEICDLDIDEYREWEEAKVIYLSLRHIYEPRARTREIIK